jgi:multidrug efflux pump subunit AcrB
VYIRDVANVTVGLTEPTTFSRLSVESEPSTSAISFNIYKQRGGDITELAASIRDAITELSEPNEPLAGLTTYTIQDAGEQIESDLLQLTRSGLQTVTLVILVLIIAIGWREGLIAGTAIPLTFMIGFIGLYLSGNTINFISLFALILGIGVLVDSSIVMVEGINSRMKDQPEIDKVEAALLTIREFHLPLTAGTLTTVAMFVGLFIVSGVTGQFIASIPFTLIFVLFASLLVALGFIPLIASSFLKRRNATRLERLQFTYNHRFEDWYRQKLSTLLRSRGRKWRFVLSLLVGFVAAIALIPLGVVQVEFFSQSDADQIFIEIEQPEGTIKETTDIAAR